MGSLQTNDFSVSQVLCNVVEQPAGTLLPEIMTPLDILDMYAIIVDTWCLVMYAIIVDTCCLDMYASSVDTCCHYFVRTKRVLPKAPLKTKTGHPRQMIEKHVRTNTTTCTLETINSE